jgi:hypothetical protein
MRCIPFFRSSVKQAIPVMVHESQEGNFDLQRKSAMNEKQDYETY